MEKLFEIQNTLLQQIAQQDFYERDVFTKFAFDNPVCGLVGQRGVGKSTFMLRYALRNGALEQRALYVSADNIYFTDVNLFDLVDRLFKETSVRLLLIDEIHKYENWAQHIKNIRDTYPDFRVIFSGSSQIDLVHGEFDLSRRVTLYHLPGFSFREYLEFNGRALVKPLSFDELLSSHVQLAKQVNYPDILRDFYAYLRCGYYPFYREFRVETERFAAIENIAQKMIYEDIGSMHALKTPTLVLIEKLYKFVLSSSPGEINASRLASNLGKDYSNISDYLGYLQQAGLIRFLPSDKSGSAQLRNAMKIYPDNSNQMFAAYFAINEDAMRGKVRETFLLSHLQNADVPTFYSNRGDFWIQEHIVEVGGPNKAMTQLQGIRDAYLFKDGLYTGIGNTIPLHLAGYLY